MDELNHYKFTCEMEMNKLIFNTTQVLYILYLS